MKLIELFNSMIEYRIVKILSMECYDRQTPVQYNQYTKFHISDAGVGCVNIDKSYITATMTYHMKFNKLITHPVTGDTISKHKFLSNIYWT